LAAPKLIDQVAPKPAIVVNVEPLLLVWKSPTSVDTQTSPEVNQLTWIAFAVADAPSLVADAVNVLPPSVEE